MDGFEIRDPRFRHYVLDNAGLEEIAAGFRWVEGPVWMGDWNCLLFQDLPRNRTMRWSEAEGLSVYRAPSDYGNGQARDGEGRLITCSHHGRCLYRTEHDGRITRLVESHAGKRLNAPNDVVVKSDGTIWFTDPLYGEDGAVECAECRDEAGFVLKCTKVEEKCSLGNPADYRHREGPEVRAQRLEPCAPTTARESWRRAQGEAGARQCLDGQGA